MFITQTGYHDFTTLSRQGTTNLKVLGFSTIRLIFALIIFISSPEPKAHR